MTPLQLKATILQQAVQGKLARHDEAERAEITVLNSFSYQKKRKPKISVSSSMPADNKPFDVPDNWLWARVGDVFELINGDRGKNYPAKSSLLPIGQIPFISAINFENFKIKQDGLLFVSEKQYSLLRSGKLKKYDFLFCLRGSLGKCCQFEDDIGAIASSLVILRKKAEIEDGFVKAYLLSPLLAAQIHARDNGTAQPNLGARDVSNFWIPLPPINEQKRIVEKIESLMPLVNEYERTYNALQALNEQIPVLLEKSILQFALKGKLVPQLPEEGTGRDLLDLINKEKSADFIGRLNKKCEISSPFDENTLPFDIPNTWEWVRLGEIMQLISGSDLTPDKYNSSMRGTVYLTGASNIEEEKLIVNRWTEEPKNIANKGDLLVTCKGTIGKVAVLELESVHIARQIMALRPILVDVQYLKFFILAYVSRLRAKAKSMIPGIERSDLIMAHFPLPPLAEQRRIVSKINELLLLIKSLKIAPERG